MQTSAKLPLQGRRTLVTPPLAARGAFIPLFAGEPRVVYAVSTIGGRLMMKLSVAAFIVATLAIAAAMLGLPGRMFAQGATCSSWYDACYQKSVQGMAPAKAKSDCNSAIRKCKQSGCFVGPHSGSTFACNLAKQ